MPEPPLRILALGATSAIAAATLRLYAEQGARFFLVARKAEKVAAVRKDLLTRGAVDVRCYVADLDRTDDHQAMLCAATSALGGIDIALIAHGILGAQAKAEREYKQAEVVLRTNLLSVISLAGWLANYCEEQRHGVVAVISSVAGDRGRKSNYIYGASKGGLNIYLDGLRNRAARAGVQIVTIKPGIVKTPMTAHLAPTLLFAEPSQVACGIFRAINQRKAVAYVPGFWRWIMLAVRMVPEPLFRRMSL